MKQQKCHYDEYLDGVTLCGLSTHDIASEDLKQVTCKNCLKKAKYKWECKICRIHFREKEAHGCFTKNKQWKRIK